MVMSGEGAFFLLSLLPLYLSLLCLSHSEVKACRLADLPVWSPLIMVMR